MTIGYLAEVKRPAKPLTETQLWGTPSPSYKLSVISEGCPCCVLLESTYGAHMLQSFRVEREQLDAFIGHWQKTVAETGAPYRVERHDTN